MIKSVQINAASESSKSQKWTVRGEGHGINCSRDPHPVRKIAKHSRGGQVHLTRVKKKIYVE